MQKALTNIRVNCE
jgi:hypothetical protein